MKRKTIISGQIRGQKMATNYYHNKEWKVRKDQMGRRGENIHKRRDKRWEVRVVIGPPVNGKTRYKSIFAHSYAEARAKKLAFLESLNAPPSSTAPVLTPPQASAAPVLTPPQASTAPLLSPPPTSEEPVFTPLPPFTTAEYCEFSFLDNVLPLSIPLESFDVMAQEPQVIFREVAEQWLSSKKLAWKESSFAFYSVIVEKHLLPTFGETAIKKVDSAMIASFLTEKKHHGRIKNNGPLSDKTVSEIKSILSRILRYAKSRQFLDEIPEFVPVTVKKTPVKVLTNAEQKRLESQAIKEDTPFTLGVLLCIYTGIREGEVCALKWEDFDWENGTISIKRTVSRINDTAGESGSKTHIVIDTPKTECSMRTVPIPDRILPYFRERAGSPANYMITGKEKCMEPRVCRDRFKRFQARAGVAYHNFHILRHTYATNCIDQGIDVNTLKANLGHSDISITLQLYVHPSMESRKAQVNKLKTFAD